MVGRRSSDFSWFITQRCLLAGLAKNISGDFVSDRDNHFGIGFLFAKDSPSKDNGAAAKVSGHDIGTQNIVTAGRDIHQTIHMASNRPHQSNAGVWRCPMTGIAWTACGQ
jgi:hypothetical protein